MRNNPRPNEVYRHFKGMLYQIVNIAKHSETMEPLVIYQQLYAPFGVYARPLDMFMSEVDHKKYPEVMQTYRFEKIQEPVWETDFQEQGVEDTKEVSLKEPADCKSTQDSEEEPLDSGIVQFLEADTYEEKLEILNTLHPRITDEMIDTMAVCIDVQIEKGELEQRYQELFSCLLKMEKFECNRLR